MPETLGLARVLIQTVAPPWWQTPATPAPYIPTLNRGCAECRLYNNQKRAVDAAVAAIVKSPELGEAKRGDLAGIYVYKLDCMGQQFLLAYEWDPTLRILRAVGVHENFYCDLKRSS